MKKGKFIKALIIGALMINFLPISSVGAISPESGETTKTGNSTTITGDYQKAIDQVILPRVESDGTVTKQKVSEYLRKKLNNQNINIVKDDDQKSLAIDFQIKDVYLASSELNGLPNNTGISFFNMLNFYTNLLQLKQVLIDNIDYSVVDAKGTTYTEDSIDKYLELVKQIVDFDSSTNLKYNSEAAYDKTFFKNNPDVGGTDVIATGRDDSQVSFSFHIDSHGYWGYDLGAHDSITGLVMGLDEKTAYDKQNEMTTKYGNFFKIDMNISGPGKLYMLKNTDLQNPMIYVSEDGTEAFMIDVDFYGENVLNQLIKDVIGPKCKSLKIYFTHNHGDHVNNLAQIHKDADLKKIITILWPENEPHTLLGGKTDLTTLFGEPEYVKDMQVIQAAGRKFQFVEIPNEHTPGGGQLLDLDSRILYSGDTLGAQVHLGGTSVRLKDKETINDWVKALNKSVDYIKKNDVKYIIGGHTGYLNTPEFATWVQTAVNYGKQQLDKNPTWKGLVIVESGKVVSEARMKEMFAKGLTDREELKIASVNFMNAIPTDSTVEQKPEDNTTSDKTKPTKPNSNNNSQQKADVVKTSDNSMIARYSLLAIFAVGVVWILLKKKHTIS